MLQKLIGLLGPQLLISLTIVSIYNNYHQILYGICKSSRIAWLKLSLDSHFLPRDFFQGHNVCDPSASINGQSLPEMIVAYLQSPVYGHYLGAVPCKRPLDNHLLISILRKLEFESHPLRAILSTQLEAIASHPYHNYCPQRAIC